MSGVILLLLRLGLAVVLYVFIGWVVLTIWRDLKFQEKLMDDRCGPSLRITIQIKDELQTQEFTGQEITIGRDPNCDCTLNSETVSATHTQLIFRQSQWWVEDLHSTNGTLLNGDRVETPTVVANNDVLQCGQARLTVQILT
jgi:hypothetical protein